MGDLSTSFKDNLTDKFKQGSKCSFFDYYQAHCE